MSHSIQTVLALAIALQVPPASAGAAIGCQADLADLAGFMKANDAGAEAHLSSHREAIAQAFDTAHAAAAGTADAADCDGILQTYLQAWRPTHIQLVPAAGTAPRVASAPAGVDPRAPRLRILDQDTALLVLPSFDLHYAAPIAALLAEQRTALAARKHWIIDVRDNDGGDDGSFAPLRPWLLDGHVHRHGVEYLATKANIQSQLDVCAYVGEPAACARQIAPLVASMRAAPIGSFVLSGKQRFESIPVALEADRPARVAILTDRGCASSCEQFVLEARTGFRVKVVGRPTMGALDYSNLRPYKLASGRILFYATSRSTRLPDMQVDAAGIQPDILLPAPLDAAGRDAGVDAVRRWLAGDAMQPATPLSGTVSP
ncbi:S41 family peptidase [Massilia timonae]|uniref:S41 family peptidase n=1 Tax=Massilia timonae TaxID=47229 RepID=UPI0028D05A95|nr:S41 family peptidase [Massilia timonae]